MNYYDHETETTSSVYFKLLDESGKVIRDYPGEACFSTITYALIPKGTAVVSIRHEKARVPYKVSEIKRWIADINEMGFPCSFVDEPRPSEIERQKEYIHATVNANMNDLAKKLLNHGQDRGEQSDEEKCYHFEVRVKDFEYKSHFISTLMLVRCLTETEICKVPEIYFQMMDADPATNKFDAMQTAHKKLGPYGHENHYHNTNHMITYDGNGSNVTQEKLWARYKACGFKVMDGDIERSHRIEQSNKWNGELN